MIDNEDDKLLKFVASLRKNPDLHRASQQARRVRQFLRGRTPMLLICPDGVIRAVGPSANIELLGTNVIPLPRPRRNEEIVHVHDVDAKNNAPLIFKRKDP